MPPVAPPKPRCTIEVIDPDDVLVLGINNKWFRSFTSNSDRYPIRLEVPPSFLNEGWNLVTGSYTNVALEGKNECTVEYKVFLDEREVVHVTYRTEVKPLHFSLTFKDTFSLRAQKVERGVTAKKKSKRFDEMMAWGDTTPESPPPLPEE